MIAPTDYLASLTNPAFFADEDRMHRLFTEIRTGSDPLPFIESDGYPRFWFVSKYDDVVAIERNAETFISAPRQALLPLAEEQAFMEAAGRTPSELARTLPAMDGEEHRLYRSLTHSEFTPRAVKNLRSGISRLAAEFVDRLIEKGGECDFVSDVAVWYPLRVIMNILGVPPEDEAYMLKLTQQGFNRDDPELNAEGVSAYEQIQKFYDYFLPVVQKYREQPVTNIAGVIANARLNGEFLRDIEAVSYYMIIATAGHDTTSNTTAAGLLGLLRNPEQMAKLRESPALIDTAVDEFIRWASPVRHFLRTATADHQIRSKKIRKGDLLLLSYPSANRDEEAFADPFAFKVDRSPNRHLAFGTGPHICLGMYLAKYEIASFFRELLSRVHDIELAGDPSWTESIFVGGLKRLPIRYRF